MQLPQHKKDGKGVVSASAGPGEAKGSSQALLQRVGRRGLLADWSYWDEG